MNNLILCEGETDAILLSYYLQRTCGWRFVKKSPPGVNIKADRGHGESANWYQRDGDYLLICAVGSKIGSNASLMKRLRRRSRVQARLYFLKLP